MCYIKSTSRRHLEFSLRTMPNCHKSHSKLLQHHHCTSRQLKATNARKKETNKQCSSKKNVISICRSAPTSVGRSNGIFLRICKKSFLEQEIFLFSKCCLQYILAGASQPKDGETYLGWNNALLSGGLILSYLILTSLILDETMPYYQVSRFTGADGLCIEEEEK